MVSAPLYLFSKFFEGKAVEHLLGAGIQGIQQVSNLTSERLAILNLFPVTCRSYYFLL